MSQQVRRPIHDSWDVAANVPNYRALIITAINSLKQSHYLRGNEVKEQNFLWQLQRPTDTTEKQRESKIEAQRLVQVQDSFPNMPDSARTFWKRTIRLNEAILSMSPHAAPIAEAVEMQEASVQNRQIAVRLANE